jgi:hypothetical protein
MFIKTVEGNLINTKHIQVIKISEPKFEQTTFNISACLTMGGGIHLLSRHNTKAEAEKEMERYFQMD